MALAIGVWLPAFLDPANGASTYTSTAASLAALDDYIDAVGTPAACALSSTQGAFSGPAPLAAGFPDFDLMTGIASRGIVPVIYWAPSGTLPRVWQNWADGMFDEGLDGWCTDYRNWIMQPEMVGLSTTVIIRLAQEMNGSFFPYGVTVNGNTVTRFKNGWRHFHDRIRVVNGCTDVGLFWCPFNTHNPKSPTEVWPGTAANPYCQYMGIDAYPHTTDDDPPVWADVNSMRATLNTMYNEVTALDPDLPFAVGESGISIGGAANGFYTDQQRRSWIDGTQPWNGTGSAGGFEWVAANHPRTRLFMYFDISGWALHSQASYPLLYGAMSDALTTYANPFDVTGQPVSAPAMPLSFG